MKYGFQQCIGARLRQLSRITDSYYRQCLTDYNITEKQITILFALSKFKNVEQGKLGLYLKLECSTVSRNVKLLEEMKLLKRTAQYRPVLALTQKGDEMVKILTPVWEKAMDELTHKLGKEGMKNLQELENKLKF